MTYPTRVRPLTSATRVATRWLVLSGTLAAGLLFGCSDDTGTTDDVYGTPTSGTHTSTSGSVTSVTTGGTTSTTGGTSAGTLGTTAASITTSGTTTTTGTQSSSSSSSSSGSLGSTTGTTGGAGGTSSSSTDTATGTTGSTEFQPCPATGPCKVLPLGDSITVGLGFDGGYRVQLFHLALEGGHDITFTGTQQPNGPAMVDGVTFPRNHEGISGQLISEIANRVPSPGLTDMPHIILVHAGTNDMNRMANGASDRLEDLMDKLIAEAPDALIVMGNIIPLPGNATLEAFNASIPPMVEERASGGSHIIFADQFTGFENSDLGDGVHPNEGGYTKMANVWFEAIEPYLP